jgi:hypothetical protein
MVQLSMACRVPVKAAQWRLNATTGWQNVQHTAGRWIIDSPENVSSKLHGCTSLEQLSEH